MLGSVLPVRLPPEGDHLAHSVGDPRYLVGVSPRVPPSHQVHRGITLGRVQVQQVCYQPPF